MEKFFSGTWFFTRAVSTEHVGRIPEKSTPFTLGPEGMIDLDHVAGKGRPQEECMVYNAFSLKEDRILGFGLGCDWWCEVRLNGEMIYTTFPGGNETGGFSIENHSFKGQGRKGDNLLAIRIRRGTGSWTFCAGEREWTAVDPCSPFTVTLDPSDVLGTIKPMNAVNNGPIRARSDQTRGNFSLWRAAKIPFARNHDAAFCSSYGGEHAVDVHAIFPDFSKDPEDPASYDFTLTDHCIQDTLDAGTQIFYRLGSKIEHNEKKYGTVVPPDFKKWAVICEHIIRHCNEGWADGHHWNIVYWEIWNEPDLSDCTTDKKTWQGTPEEFFSFYRIAACHLKQRFPHLKIGGPALCGNLNWMKRFLESMTEGERVPFDFFSWHRYGTNPNGTKATVQEVRRILDRFGYRDTESILNEWNYVRGWTDEWIYSIRTMIGLKGAVFTAATMSACQDAPLDMLMYYDARPCAMNGIFDFYTFAPLKGYYTFVAWAKLAELGSQISVDTQGKTGIFATAATDGNGKTGLLLSRYFEPDDLPGDVEITIRQKNGATMGGSRLLLLDDQCDLTEIPYYTNKDNSIRFSMKANTLIYLEL